MQIFAKAPWARVARTWPAVLLVTALLGAGATRAQPGATPPNRPGAGAAAAPTPAKDRVKQKLLALRAYRLTEELGLDQTSAARVFPVLSKYDGQLEQLTVERVDLTRKLKQNPSGATADDLVNRAMANRRALLELEERRMEELRKVLTPAQAARLLVVMPEIEAQLKRQIRQVLRKRNADSQEGELVDPFDSDGPTQPKRRRRGDPLNSRR